MLEEGLSYPGWGERWTGRFIIGSTLALSSFLLLPLLPLYGYFMRAMGTSARGRDRPPQWRGWGKLTVSGARALVVSLVYALVPNLVGGIVLFVVLLMFGGGAEAGGETGMLLARLGVVALLVGVLVVLAVEFTVVYTLPAALLNVAAEDSFTAAFDVGSVTDIAFSGAYITALVHLAFVWFVTLVAGGTLGLTGVLLPVVLFWSGLVTARLFGVAYRSANGTAPASDATYTPVEDALAAADRGTASPVDDRPTGGRDPPSPTGSPADASTPADAGRDP